MVCIGIDKNGLKTYVENELVLIIAVSEPWFTFMERGEKDKEFRTPSNWIKSRLFDKKGDIRHYHYIKIINGYGNHRPSFIAKFEGFATGYDKTYYYGINSPSEIPFAEPRNTIKVNPEDYVIFLGEIISRQNIIK
jgi:hypothetical protein